MNYSSTPNQNNNSNNLSVLIIDDNDGFRDILVQYLTRQGLKVDSADNGLSGLKKFLDKTQKYNAILMDVQMPVMDGYETLERIRETVIGGTLPIIAMSGAANENGGKGFDVYLRKPFQLEELIPAIWRVIRNGRKEVAL